ncbi:polar amino acid transport system ATP-binding protein [Aquamicrobium lusatiense]|jgi:polar amino acid transport system ATP-binding protein|uniref:Polar amino acid transport system ATP-binding protein n=1 Tax=Aquamicrobium lusatiense TaxID=89772 RepID=A0A7W9S0W2_9HYPH|nr:amino acid ABC transporter ATP-binding protein [Aquamicrobium lusatiense]MBB6011840.1 polar amino acid transport system ATP-binding protein [Aquamicrobium lusatiense]
MSKTILELQGLEMAFGQLSVLRGVDLKVEEGESIAIIGPSGSGKSTLLRCLNRLETPTGGNVLFEGNRIDARTDINQLRTRMGMVFQQFNLFPHMTALANVMEAPVHVRGIKRDQAEAEARRLLEKVGMLEKANSFPRQLSGGQKQRVAIARCLAMQPRLLLLDEITSALDPELVGEVLDVVRDLARQGMTMLLVTHEMRFAREFADRVVFMDGGVVVEVGPPEEVFTRPKSERLRKFLTAVLEQTT